MIEQGFVVLIQGALATALPGVPGGYFAELPKDAIGTASGQSPMAWVYRSIASEPSYVLEGQDGFTAWTVRIDCHGDTPAHAMQLARALDAVLRGGFQGTLADPDQTVVQGIFRQGSFIDGFSDANRSYVRTLEYLVNYNEQ